VKTLFEDGKISWDNQTEVIYLLDGNVSTAAEYDEVVLKFTDTATPGTFTVGTDTKVSVRTLVVGGGGAGGTSTSISAGAGGGGGAGGFVDQTQTIEEGTYIITVGKGGAAATSTETATRGGDGNDSSFIGAAVSIIAKGGGGGGAQSVGNPGGSGGGGSYALAACTGGTTNGLYYVRGSAGGRGAKAQYGAGGGGAGENGKQAGNAPGAGGSGLTSDILLDGDGEPIYYAGGGGGGRTKGTSGMAGGSGGGGKGGSTDNNAENGTDGLGGGGGGGGSSFAGNGGAGVVILRIRDLIIDVPDDILLVWNDDDQIGYEPKNYYEFVGGTTNATLANTYTYQIKPAGEFEWKNWTVSSKETKTISWTIVPMPVDIPATTNIVYDGTKHVVAADNWAYNVVSGIGAATNAANYSVTVSLLDIANTTWADGTTTDKTINWAIVPKSVEKPTHVEGLIYSGTNSIVFTEYEGVVYKAGVTNSVNAGYFHYTVALDNPVGYTNYVWVGESDEKSVEDVRVNWEIAPQLVDVPEPRTGLVYNGSPQNAFESLDWSHYSLMADSTTNETAGGSYEAMFYLSGNSVATNFVWNVLPKTFSKIYSVTWSIGADTNEITELKLVGWRIGGTPKTPTISAKWGADTVEYYYGFGDNAESVTSWTTSLAAITNAGTWVLRAVIPETTSWTAVTNYTTFVMWDDPGMLFRNWVEIFVKGTTNELSNFIVPVRVSEDLMQGFYYDEASPTNLVFVDKLGNLLSYDVDTWDTSGESVVWVKLVTLPMAGMPVTMYWNLKEGQIPPENTSTDVWSDYVGVWHMSEPNAGTATVRDASGHKDGTGHKSSYVAAGIFGKARGRHETPNTSGYAHGPAVAVQEYTDLDEFSNGAFTISGWVMLRSTTTGWAYLFARKNGDTTTGWAAQFRGSTGSSGKDDGISFWRAGGSGQYYTFNTANKFSANTWAKYDFVRDGNTLAFYLNGSLVEKKTGIGTIEGGNQPFTIGGMNIESTDPSGKASTLNGYSDEVRLMPAAIDSAYIAADYKYQSDPTMSTNGVVYLDKLQVDYWVVEPVMEPTNGNNVVTWDIADTVKGQITNSGQLRYGEVTNYIYSVYDESEVYSTPDAITNAGNYRAVFTQVDTNGYQRIEKVFEIRVTKSKPYTKIGGTNGNSGRVLLMNRDRNTACQIDRQGYSDTASNQSTFWQILGDLASDTNLTFNLKPGWDSILWTRNYGTKLWYLENCRHGNTYPTDVASGSLVSSQNFLPYSSTSRSIMDRNEDANQSTAGQVVMRNLKDAAVYSPCYTNGIGTIYFDAVNGWAEDTTNYTIVVEYATNTVDHLEPFDANCVLISTNIVDEGVSSDYMVVTNGDEVSTNYYVVVTNDYGKLDGCWHAAEMIPFMRDTVAGTGTFDRLDETNELALAVTHGGTKGNFYRVAVPLDYHEFIRFRIRRISNNSGWQDPDVYALILLDNIIASVPAMSGTLESRGRFDESKTGHEILGWELATSVPYPSIYDSEIIGGAKPSFFINVGDGTTWNTNDFFQSATMHYRWRYLNQTVGPWRTIELNPYNGFKALSKFELPGRACDVEYWYDYRLQAPYYEYVDYSGIGKQINYTEERGWQTNALNSASLLSSAGTNWFFRVREGKSDYSGLDIVFRRGDSGAEERSHMMLIGNNVWRGFVQTLTNQTGTIKYRIEAHNRQTEEFADYSASTNYLYCAANNPALPVSDSLVGGTDESWSTLTLDATTGYVMFQVDEGVAPMALTIVHADYQNFNTWSDACKDIFVGNSTEDHSKIGTSPKKRTFAQDFDTWNAMGATDVKWQFSSFDDIQYMLGRKAYEPFASDTDGKWSVGPGMWVSKKYMVASKNVGVALQMEGNGKGYLQFIDRVDAPRGLESISFRARLGQFVQFDDFAYYYAGNILSLSNYTFMARTAFDLASNTNFDGNASLSMVANYLPNKGCYEARWEWLGTGSNEKRGQRMCLYRWNVKAGKKISTLIVAKTNTVYDVNGVSALNSTEKFYPMFISVSNDVSSTYIIAAVRRSGATLGTSPLKDENGYSTSKNECKWFGVCARDTSADRLKVGSYGVLTANSDGVFARPEFSHTVPYINNKATDVFENLAIAAADDLKGITNCAEKDLQSAEYPGWNIVPGRMTNTYTSAAINAVMSAPLEQKLQIYLGSAGDDDWDSTPCETILLNTFGGNSFTKKLYTTRDCSVKFAVDGSINDVRTDVVIDSVSLRQWRGDDYKNVGSAIVPDWIDPYEDSESNPGYGMTNWIFTSAWTTNTVSGSGSNVKTNGMLLLSAKRTRQGSVSSIRSPLMDNYNMGYGNRRGIGLGMVSYEYKDAQENARLIVQIATNNVNRSRLADWDEPAPESWVPVVTNDFSKMTAEKRKGDTIPVYIGLHGVTGLVRIVVDPALVDEVADETDPARFGEVFVTKVVCRDEPSIDSGCWWGWNMRTIGTGEGVDVENKMYLPDFSRDPEAVGMSLALNNSVTDDVDEEDKETYKQNVPFVQTPTFTSNIVGEVAFKARKYDTNVAQPASVTLYGMDTTGGVETWQAITNFVVTASTYEYFAYKTDPGKNYAAFRLGVSGVKGASDSGLVVPEGYDDPVRVLIDEVFVCEAVRARMSFRNVGAFRSKLSDAEYVPNVPGITEQPLCNESWGVECEVFAAQLENEIDMTRKPSVILHWFEGIEPWGFEKWRGKSSREGHHQAPLAPATGTNLIYRSSYLTAEDAVVPMSTVPGTVIQYMLEVRYFQVGSSTVVTNWLARGSGGEGWERPSWYRGVDYNADLGGNRKDEFAAYNILDTVPPGWAWINEVNIHGTYNDDWVNSEDNAQFVEIAVPVESDISGWEVRLLGANTEDRKGTIVTNIIATFGTSELPGMKPGNIGEASRMVFRVIACPKAFTSGTLKASEGELDTTWDFSRNYTDTFMSSGRIMEVDAFGIQLIRPSKIIEHEITCIGTNYYGSMPGYEQYYSPTNTVEYFRKYMRDSSMFYAGEDCADRNAAGEFRSLGVFQSNGAVVDNWNNTMKRTPGRINENQTINSDLRPTPNGESIMVFCSLDPTVGHIRQTVGTAVETNTTQTIYLRRGSDNGTNIVYTVDQWYELASVTTNGKITAFSPLAEPRKYVVTVGIGASNNVSVVASAKVEDRLQRDFGLTDSNPYTPAILDWLDKGTDLYGNEWPNKDSNDIFLADFIRPDNSIVTNLNLTQMYWLDMDPTIGNLALKGYISDGPTLIGMASQGSGTGYSNLRFDVFMQITNRASAAAWAPYALRGLTPGSSSFGYTNRTTATGWKSATFKMVGFVLTEHTGFQSRDNWVPLRWFVFTPESFRKPGSAKPFTSTIEIVDPFSKSSPAWTAGWYDWAQEHGKPQDFYFWCLDERLEPIAVEVLKEDNPCE